MDEVRLHVTGIDQFFDRAMKAARRLDSGDSSPAPFAQVGFESMEQLLRLLTPNRWTLLRSLKLKGPLSIRALSKALGRDYRGVHADVTSLLQAGLIDHEENGLIRVPWSRITAEMSLEAAA